MRSIDLMVGGLVLAVTTGSLARAECVDYADPPADPLLGYLEIPGDPGDITLRDGVVTLAVTDPDGGTPVMMTVDVSDPSAPTPLDTIASPAAYGRIVLEGDQLHAAGPSLAHFDASDPTDLVALGTLDAIEFPSQNARALAVVGTLAYLATEDERLVIADVSGDPLPLGDLAIGAATSLNDLVVKDGYVYLVGIGGLFIVDATDPAAPEFVDTISLENQGTSIGLVGSTAIVAVFERASATFDLSAPGSPAPLGTGPSLARFATTGTILYAIEASDLTAYDYSDPTSPEEIGSLTFFFSFDLAVDGCLVAGFNPFFPPEELRLFPAHDRVTVSVPGYSASAPAVSCAPNPMSTMTTLRLEGVTDGETRVTIHDVRGRRVRTLHGEVDATGSLVVRWDGRDDVGRRPVPGVYVCVSGDGVTRGRITVAP